MLSEKEAISRPSSANQTSDESSTFTDMPLGDKPDEDTAAAADTHSQHEHQYLEGLQLVLVIACVTLVCFLVLLDTSIIATVRHNP